MKKDPANYERRYKNWQERIKENGGIPEISETNSDTILKYINDMQNGIIVSMASVKGGRSYARLNNITQRMVWFAKKFDEFFNLEDMTQINEEQLLTFFNYMRNGTLKQEGKIKRIQEES